MADAPRRSLVVDVARTIGTAICQPKAALDLLAGIAIAARRNTRQPVGPARRRLRAITRWVRLPWDFAVMAFWWLLMPRAYKRDPYGPGGPGCEARHVCRYPHCDCPTSGPCGADVADTVRDGEWIGTDGSL